MKGSESKHKVPIDDDMPLTARLVAPILRSGHHVPEVHRGTAPHDLVAVADQALYQAKISGRNRGCAARD